MRKSLRQMVQRLPKCANCNVNCYSNEDHRAFSDPLEACQSRGIGHGERRKRDLKPSHLRQEGNFGGTKASRVKMEVDDTAEICESETESDSVSDHKRPRKSRKITTILDALLRVFSKEWKAESDLLKFALKDKENLILCSACSVCLTQTYENYSKFVQFSQESQRQSFLYPVICHGTKSEYPLHSSYKISAENEATDSKNSSYLQLHHRSRLVKGSVVVVLEKEPQFQPGSSGATNVDSRTPELISPRVLKNEPADIVSDLECGKAEIELGNDSEEEWMPLMEMVEPESKPPLRPGSGWHRRQKAVGKRGPHRKVKCSEPGCPELFLYHWLMNHHVQMKHENKKPSKCAKCKFSTFDPDVIESHYCMDSNEEEGDSAENLRFRCGFCNQPFSSKSSVIQHSRIHDRSLIKCTFMNCHRSFLRMSHLENHERIKHGVHADAPNDINEGHQCSECGKVFSTKATYKSHLEIHSSVRKYLCLHCGMSFKQRRALTRHNLIHKDLSAIRLHQCPLCHKIFKRGYNLIQHYHTKVHPQSVVEKLIKGEELQEEDFRDSMSRRTRIVKKRNEGAEVIGPRPTSPSAFEGKKEAIN